MNNKSGFLLVHGIWTIILIVGTIGVSAQVTRKKNAPIEQIPVPASDTSLNETVKNLSTVSGVIRWSKSFGLPPTGPATSQASPLPCGLMVVVVMKNIGVPGSFGSRQEQIATSFDQVRTSKELKALEDRNSYVCPYSISGLPRNANLTVTVRFLDPAYEKIQWIGSRLSPDYERVFLSDQNLRLTAGQPNAVVNFIIGLSPVPEMPR